MSKKYSTKHIKEKSLQEQAALAHIYYRRARKAEDDLEHVTRLLHEQQNETSNMRDAIRDLVERTAA